MSVFLTVIEALQLFITIAVVIIIIISRCKLMFLIADTQYMEFIAHPRMVAIRSRTVWVHVEVPGQGHNADDLPPE